MPFDECNDDGRGGGGGQDPAHDYEMMLKVTQDAIKTINKGVADNGLCHECTCDVIVNILVAKLMCVSMFKAKVRAIKGRGDSVIAISTVEIKETIPKYLDHVFCDLLQFVKAEMKSASLPADETRTVIDLLMALLKKDDDADDSDT